MVIRGLHLLSTRSQIEVVQKTTTERIKMTLSFPIVTSGVALGLVNIIRYGVITWIPVYLYQNFNMPIEKVGVNIFLIPIAGILGTLLYDKIKLPKDLTTVLYMVGLGTLFLVFPVTSGLSMFALLLLSGFFMYGPHVFLVSTMPSRFHDKSIVAASTGFIDGVGYIGATMVGIIVPFIIDKTGEWTSVFYFWSAMSFVTIILVGAVYLKSWRSKGVLSGL